MANYEEFFKNADKDGSGELSVGELISALKNGGYAGSDSDIKALFGAADMSGDNQVSLQEFLEAMGAAPPTHHKEARLRQCFREFDKDGSGEIDRQELKQVFAEMGKSFSDEELERMIGLADKDASGTMNYEEFIKQVFGK